MHWRNRIDSPINCTIIKSIHLLAPFADNVNCYVGRNEGNYCNSKDQTKALTRWYYDKKGVCRPFSYRGCNGNRNRFCTQESCEARCGDQ